MLLHFHLTSSGLSTILSSLEAPGVAARSRPAWGCCNYRLPCRAVGWKILSP